MSKPHTATEGSIARTSTSFHEKTPHSSGDRLSRRSLRSHVRRFITDHRAASIATANGDGTPHVAVVYAIIHNDLSIYFSTRVEGRKYQNILQQPVVAMAFSHENSVQMVQLSGRAERVEDLREEQSLLHDLMKLRYNDPNWPLPPMRLFERGATTEIAVIRVVPTELTFADFQSKGIGRYQPFFYKII